MTTIDDAAREAADPTTPPARLAELLSTRPDLGAMIALHPQAYPEMLAWIGQHGEPAARAAVLTRLAPPAQPQAVPAASPTAQAAPNLPAVLAGGGASAAPAPVIPAAGDPATSSAAPARRKLRRPAIIGIIAGVAVLALAGGAFAVVKTLTGGAPSPEAAAQKLVDGALGGDLLSLATAFAPSETQYLRPMLDEAAKIPGTQKDAPGAADAVTRMRDAAKITVKDFTFVSERIADGVSVVELQSGTVRIDGDPKAFASAFVDFEVAIEPTSARGSSSSEIEQQKAEISKQLRTTFPITWEAKDFVQKQKADGGFNPLRVVAVDEGGWYVSPLLTATDFYNRTFRSRSAFGGSPDSIPALGDRIVEAAHFDTPEAALKGIADGVKAMDEQGDWKPLAQALPLPERRLLSVYGPQITNGWEQSALQRNAHATITTDVDRTEADGSTILIPRRITATFASNDNSQTLMITKDCVSVTWSGGNPFCLSSVPTLAKLDITEFHVVATQENGGWLVNPLATISQQGVLSIRAYAKYAADGRLDDLFGGSGGE